MPILGFFFSTAFIMALARVVIIGLGFGFITFKFSSALLFQLQQFIVPTLGYWQIAGLSWMLTATGIMDGIAMVMGAFAVKFALAAAKRIMPI